jgi:CHAT domain-containing protein
MLSGFPLTPEPSRFTASKSTNGFLQSYEIYGLNLSRPRLVVLSACQTGIEQQYAGEGAVSAARPFQVAGVPIVVATLWPVDSDASAELMANFHRHPYYWAPFLTIGGLSSY